LYGQSGDETSKFISRKDINKHKYYLQLYLRYRKFICNTKFIKNAKIFCY